MTRYKTRLLLLSAAAALLCACADADTDTLEVQASTQDTTQDTTRVGTPAAPAAPAARTPAPTPAPTLAQTAQTAADERDAARAGVTPLSEIENPVLSKAPISDDIDILMGRGGNVAVLYGPDGALLVDDKFAENADEILAHVASRGGALPAFVLNTHYHGDHTGSNAAMREVGALLIAQDGTYDLMSRDIENQLFGRTLEARPESDRPDLTFQQEMTLRFGDETLRLQHLPNAHTGGDMTVHFQDADVLHMGDIFFNGMFPVIDIDAGGSLQGLITALDTGARVAGPDTVVIPGHGPVTDREGLLEFRDRMAQVRDRMSARIAAGDTLDAIIEADIYADYGWNDGFIDNETITRVAHRSLTMNRP